MSSCEHNNHGHFLIWLMLITLAFVDVSGDRAKQDKRIKDLETEVQMLKAKP